MAAYLGARERASCKAVSEHGEKSLGTSIVRMCMTVASLRSEQIAHRRLHRLCRRHEPFSVFLRFWAFLLLKISFLLSTHRALPQALL